MKTVSGSPARPLAAAAWDAVGLILAAVRKAGSSLPLRVRDALEQTAGFRAVTGPVDMDRKTHRMSPLPVAIMRFTDGLAVTVDPHYLPRAVSREP
jgi:branched-chain amino acid transport system substrate-binding protein